jgi:hypothetical protein
MPKTRNKYPQKSNCAATVPNFHIHVSVSDLYIPTIDLPILLQEICGPILGIHKSLTQFPEKDVNGTFVAVHTFNLRLLHSQCFLLSFPVTGRAAMKTTCQDVSDMGGTTLRHKSLH